MRITSLLPAIALVVVTSGATASDYLGADKCRSCHEQAWQQWKTTPHARAADVLSAAERRDPRCTGCHATSARDGLLGVQCESCHGPGRHYWPEFIMKDLELARAAGLRSGGDPAACRSCHTADSPALRPFDAVDALRHVLHRPPVDTPPPGDR